MHMYSSTCAAAAAAEARVTKIGSQKQRAEMAFLLSSVYMHVYMYVYVCVCVWMCI